MTQQGTLKRADAIDKTSRYLPTPALEYWYYAQVFYSIMGVALGLSISLLGVGMLGLLCGVCVIRMGKYAVAIVRSIALPLACGVSFIAVQVLMHGDSLIGGEAVREVITWMVGLVIVQYLALRRGFLHRFAIAALFIGLSTLPYLHSFVNDASRAGLDRAVTIGNPNDLAAWFGFCCVYFTILGLETRRNWFRLISWSTAAGCLLVVGLTVSRTPLFAGAFAIVFAFRRVLKRGVVPLLALLGLAWIAYGTGLFERSATMYAQRGLEETGRLIVWPLAIERFLQSPLAGVGASHVNTYIPSAGIAVAPHNGLIYIALASGVVPLLFFAAYWVQLFATTFKADVGSHEDAPFQTSLLIYSFLIAMSLNGAFMIPWMMVTFATVAGTGFFVKATARGAAGRMGNHQQTGRRSVPALAGTNSRV